MMEQVVILRRASGGGDVARVVGKNVREILLLCAPRKVVDIKEKNIAAERRIRARKGIKGKEYAKEMVSFSSSCSLIRLCEKYYNYI